MPRHAITGASLRVNIPPRRRHDVAAVAAEGRSRHFGGKPTLTVLAGDALDDVRPKNRSLWEKRVETADLIVLDQAVRVVPGSDTRCHIAPRTDDLMIASTTLAKDLPLFTRDIDGFRGLADLIDLRIV